ncbi:MAG: hypothetical protein M3467_08970 [Actinomycetota bacterium]|nr:hypothetical protein [Actinomycetota bacterium]
MLEVEEHSDFAVGATGVPFINHSGLSDTVIAEGASMREVASTLSRWVENARSAAGRTSMFDRGAFTPPENPYDEMRAARTAMRYDDIVSGVAEITEAFAFQGVKWEGDDPDDADVFNQLSRDLNLDAVIRRMWREEYQFSQFVAASVWGWRDYVVRGKTKNGNKRKKTYRVWVPVTIRILDSLKVVPVGHGPMGSSMLAWSATEAEITHYRRAFGGEVLDPLMTEFFLGTYEPSALERAELTEMGVDVRKLLLMNPDLVFRHTLTKSDYERFADVRLKSMFTLLDMKRQLLQSDRASLIGAANYILLIRKGEKDSPAQPEEMQNLHDNYNFIAKLPVIISDHRLQIDIIAPKTDFTLQVERYDVLDTRLLARLLGTLSLGGRGQRNETNVTLSRAVAKSMENRRHMLKRTLESEIARRVLAHPRNADRFAAEPNLVYTPRNIALDIDAALIQAIMSLRTQREVSRETILEYFGLDQSAEAQRMENEEEFFDDIFRTQIPFASPGQGGAPTPNDTPEAPGVSGSRGGRPVGGGRTAESPAKQAAPKTARGNPSA